MRTEEDEVPRGGHRFKRKAKDEGDGERSSERRKEEEKEHCLFSFQQV